MNIAFCGDKDVAEPIGVCLAALRRQIAEQGQASISLLTTGWTEEQTRFVRQCSGDLDIEIHDFPSVSLPAIRAGRHVTQGAYLVFLVPTVMERRSRAIYLDSDILIRADPQPLFSLDMKDHATAGVRVGGHPFVGSPGAYPRWRQMGLNPQAPLVNTGVLVMDLDRWRAEDIGGRALSFAQRHGEDLLWADQGALNAVLQGDWLPIHPRWNATRSVFDDDKGLYAVESSQVIDEARQDPAIVHFTGATKPWKHGVERPYADEWRRLADTVGWRPWKDPVPLRTRASLARKRLRSWRRGRG